MKCYNHHDRDAMGIDRTTGKGLCLECMEIYKGMVIEKNNELSKKFVDYNERIFSAYSQAIIEHNKARAIVKFSLWGIAIICFLTALTFDKFNIIPAIFGFIALFISLFYMDIKKRM